MGLSGPLPSPSHIPRLFSSPLLTHTPLFDVHSTPPYYISDHHLTLPRLAADMMSPSSAAVILARASVGSVGDDDGDLYTTETKIITLFIESYPFPCHVHLIGLCEIFNIYSIAFELLSNCFRTATSSPKAFAFFSTKSIHTSYQLPINGLQLSS